jgi:hypothetical protein
MSTSVNMGTTATATACCSASRKNIVTPPLLTAAIIFLVYSEINLPGYLQ